MKLNEADCINKLRAEGLPIPVNFYFDGLGFYIDYDRFALTFYKNGVATFLSWDDKKARYKKKVFKKYVQAIDQAKKFLGVEYK